MKLYLLPHLNIDEILSKKYLFHTIDITIQYMSYTVGSNNSCSFTINNVVQIHHFHLFTWSRCELIDVTWSRCELMDVTWSRCELMDVTWSRCELMDVTWSRCELMDVTWSRVS